MKLTPQIKSLLKSHDLGKMNLLQLEELLKSYGIDINEIGTSDPSKGNVSVKDLRDYLIKLRKEQGIEEQSDGKDCGIDRDANPCGDASEY